MVKEIHLQETHGKYILTNAWTDRQKTDRLWYKINIPFFLKKKAGIMIHHVDVKSADPDQQISEEAI